MSYAFQYFPFKGLFSTLLLLLGIQFFLAPCSFAQGDNTLPPAKTALVLLTFGTTYEQPTDPLDLVRKEISTRHPKISLHVAYSSAHVLNSLRAKGTPERNIAQMLADLSAEGYTHVAVQSLHIIPGLEFDITRDIVNRFQQLPKGIHKVTLGMPLISSYQDAQATAEALIASLPANRKPEDAVLFIGHGAADTPIAAIGGMAYPALQCALGEKDPLLLIGTIEGDFDLTSRIETLKKSGVKKVWLCPLLTVIGDHAQNDIFGEEQDSWKSRLTKAGFQVTPIMQGLGEIPGIVSIWATHADAALLELE